MQGIGHLAAGSREDPGGTRGGSGVTGRCSYLQTGATYHLGQVISDWCWDVASGALG